MKRRIFVWATASIILASMVRILPAYGGVIVTATEIGGDVVFISSGSLDPNPNDLIQSSVALPVTGDLQSNAGFLIGVGNVVDAYELPNLTGPTSIGPGTQTFTASSKSGELLVLVFETGVLATPAGYVPESPLSGSATYSGESFASLGITPGTYTWSWTSDGVSDSITLQAVPEPPTVMLAALSIMSLAMVRWRQRNKG